jgi:hypothetical protein
MDRVIFGGKLLALLHMHAGSVGFTSMETMTNRSSKRCLCASASNVFVAVRAEDALRCGGAFK